MGSLRDVDLGELRWNKVWSNAGQNHWEVLIRC